MRRQLLRTSVVLCCLLAPAVGAPAAGAADIEPIGWAGYTPALTSLDAVVTGGVSTASATAGARSGTTVSTVGVTYDVATTTAGVRPANDPDGSGYTCWFVTRRPTGYYDERDNVLHAYVAADVDCNFDSSEITYTVNFQGYDPVAPGGFVVGGRSQTCHSTSECHGNLTYRNVYTCNGSYDHYGVPYGTYRAPDGHVHAVVGQGTEGAHNSGSSLSNYC